MQAPSLQPALCHANQHGQAVAHSSRNSYSYGYPQYAPLPYQMYRNPYSPGPVTATYSGYYGPSINSYMYVAQPYGAAMNTMIYRHQGRVWNANQDQSSHASVDTSAITPIRRANYRHAYACDSAATIKQDDVKQAIVLEDIDSKPHVQIEKDAQAAASALTEVVATACARISVQDLSELDAIHVHTATKVDEAQVATVKGDPATQFSKEKAIPLVQGDTTTNIKTERKTSVSSVTVVAIKSPEQVKSEFTSVGGTGTEAWPMTENNSNGALSGNAWDNTPLVEGWDYQRSEDWTPRGRRAPGPRSRNNNRTGGEICHSRFSTVSSSVSPPSKRIKKEPVSTPPHRVQRVEPVRSGRAALPTNNAWGNFAAVIKQDDRDLVAKAKEHDKRNGGEIFLPEITECYKDRTGKAETKLHEQIATKVAIK